MKVITVTGAILGLLLTAASLLTWYTTLSRDPVDRPLAQEYLVHYYSAAVQDPSSCCYAELDKRYHELHPENQKSTYVAFFSQYSRIDVEHVRDAGNGYFSATLTYHLKDGTVSAPERDKFQLVCDGSTKWPWKDCGVGDISIHDVTNRFK